MPSSARAIGALVNIASLNQRIGQLGLLYWDEKTKWSTVLEPAHTDPTYAFTYDVSDYSTEFATKSYIQDLAVGDFVALVLKMVSVETKETQTNAEQYLQVSGVDMDGAPVNYLRLWRFEDGDIMAGCIYIIRGLRVFRAVLG